MSNKIYSWGKAQTWYPTEIYTPETIDEIREILAKAKLAKVCVHVLGGLHSMNDIAITSGYMIRTEKLCKILNIDKDKLTVRVEGGILIHDLIHVLMKEGLTLPNQGYITEQAVAGAIATATHGSGLTGTISSFVQEIELLDADGRLHLLNPDTNPHLFSAACVHLGCLGIIYSVTLKCVPLFKLHLTKHHDRLDHILKNLDAFREKYPFFQVALDPYSDNAMVWKYSYTKEPCQNEWNYKLRKLAVKGLSWLIFDSGIKPAAWTVGPGMKLYMSIAHIKSCVDYAPLLLSPADEGHYIEMEIAVPYEDYIPALMEVRKIVDRYYKQKICMPSVIFLRFADEDDRGYLSPAYKRKTGYISLINVVRPGYENFYKEIEETLYRYKGRPHWGKVHFLTKEKTIELYGDSYFSFVEAKKFLDPHNIFSNPFTKRIFED